MKETIEGLALSIVRDYIPIDSVPEGDCIAYEIQERITKALEPFQKRYDFLMELLTASQVDEYQAFLKENEPWYEYLVTWTTATGRQKRLFWSEDEDKADKWFEKYSSEHPNKIRKVGEKLSVWEYTLKNVNGKRTVTASRIIKQQQHANDRSYY